nr:hypothetical protein [Tanacetum cinerariifolium]
LFVADTASESLLDDHLEQYKHQEVVCIGSSAKADSLADACRDLDPIVDLPALLVAVFDGALADSGSLPSLRLFDPWSGDNDDANQEVVRDVDKDDDKEGRDDEHESDEETKEEESFDPILQTPEDSEDEGDGEEDLGLDIDEEERHDEEEEEDEIYRDVNINQGRGIQALFNPWQNLGDLSLYLFFDLLIDDLLYVFINSSEKLIIFSLSFITKPVGLYLNGNFNCLIHPLIYIMIDDPRNRGDCSSKLICLSEFKEVFFQRP